MKRVVVALVGVIWTCGFQYAQNIDKDTAIVKKYIYQNTVSQQTLSSIDGSLLTEHPFGDVIARKIYLLQDSYTYVEPPTPTSPGEKTIVMKPYIYNSVLKLNRTLKKQVKKGIISRDTAIKDLNRCLDVAISIRTNETNEFESILRKAKDANQIIEVFSLVELR